MQIFQISTNIYILSQAKIELLIRHICKYFITNPIQMLMNSYKKYIYMNKNNIQVNYLPNPHANVGWEYYPASQIKQLAEQAMKKKEETPPTVKIKTFQIRAQYTDNKKPKHIFQKKDVKQLAKDKRQVLESWIQEEDDLKKGIKKPRYAIKPAPKRVEPVQNEEWPDLEEKQQDQGEQQEEEENEDQKSQSKSKSQQQSEQMDKSQSNNNQEEESLNKDNNLSQKEDQNNDEEQNDNQEEVQEEECISEKDEQDLVEQSQQNQDISKSQIRSQKSASQSNVQSKSQVSQQSQMRESGISQSTNKSFVNMKSKTADQMQELLEDLD
ncbi:hypothetical protein pb186bvf_004465 [Paramecium bursaria]